LAASFASLCAFSRFFKRSFFELLRFWLSVRLLFAALFGNLLGHIEKERSGRPEIQLRNK